MRQPVLLWLLQLPLMSAAEFLPSSGKAQGRPLNQMVSPDRSTQALLFGMRKQSKFTASRRSLGRRKLRCRELNSAPREMSQGAVHLLSVQKLQRKHIYLWHVVATHKCIMLIDTRLMIMVRRGTEGSKFGIPL